MIHFSTIAGHLQQKTQLITSVRNNKIPHAQLFWGPPGGPVLPIAWGYLTYLYCTNQQPDDACGQCNSCKKMGRFLHPDIRVTFPIPGSKSIAGADTNSNHFISAWHNFMQSQPYGDALIWRQQLGAVDKPLLIPRAEATTILQYLQTPPLEGPYKVSMIWLPEYFHPTVAHALLKTLEEPPSYVRFLLISLAPEKLLPTVRSRLQPLYIPAFNQATIQDWLAKMSTLSPEKVTEIAQLSEGNWQRAQALAAGEGAPLVEEFTVWMRLCYSPDIPKLLTLIERWLEKPKDEQKIFFAYTIHMMRRIMWHRSFPIQEDKPIQETERVLAQKLSAILDDSALQQISQWMGEAHYCLERNGHARILFLNLSLQVVQLFTHLREQRVSLSVAT